MDRSGVIIVGAGHAGAQAAISLRHAGYNRGIRLFTEESDLPYERPPLSKEYLLGDREFERILIRPAQFWADRKIGFSLDTRVTHVDPKIRTIRDVHGVVTKYDRLIWAGGGSPRRLTCNGHDLAGVHYLRDRRDADRLINEMKNTKRAVVIGGGYIGLEAAAALTIRGIRVTLIEALDRVLARVAGQALSRFFEAEHRRNAVDIRLNTAVDCIHGSEGRTTGVSLSDGTTVDADIVVVGIGIIPSVDALLLAGAAGGNGVRVDARCRTSLPEVYAVGDCALHSNPYAEGGDVRLESVQNASDMATTVAKEIVGDGSDYKAVPWFWSYQYDLKLQTVGLSSGHDEVVMRGDPAQRTFAAIYLKKGVVIALDCVNSAKDYAQGKALVAARAAVDPRALADPTRPLKSLMQS